MLVALKDVGTNTGGGRIWEFVCDCGNTKYIAASDVVKGSTKSCGCMKQGRPTGHGMCFTPTYYSWQGMHQRTRHREEYSDVSVCERWDSFENFLEDMGKRPIDMTIDRINPYGNYEPDNCRWADAMTQRHNRRVNYSE